MCCLLATALATRVSWEVPFDVVDATDLGRHRWACLLRRVLRAPRGDPRHRQFLARTARAGPVAVHLAQARGGLLVGSVIAADHAVPPGDVLAAAHQIVTAEAARPGSVARLSLFGLPLGDGPVWSVTEEHAAAGPAEQVACVLPAWAAETRLDLLGDPALGFPAIARGILAALNLGAHPTRPVRRRSPATPRSALRLRRSRRWRAAWRFRAGDGGPPRCGSPTPTRWSRPCPAARRAARPARFPLPGTGCRCFLPGSPGPGEFGPG